jgi:hypothetical protein
MRNRFMCCDTQEQIVIVHTFYNTNPPKSKEVVFLQSTHAASVCLKTTLNTIIQSAACAGRAENE